ncbi:hypothetical protein FHS95_000621 [Sphingomonas naasensis]|uniref:Uncharacterized protein n=1 Tax=Sphingomonas naasensis TaxID=1344951 RepID=A0A4S1WUW5_9SPHN|nr:hypothetical protein [Sphingomonas naasensis]NIJ18952.1 hypothetical protein [Sphingomonas naasensis]TGX46167.1 hypothetical protein E5A74_03105 [Sphingomonas naasensis]
MHPLVTYGCFGLVGLPVLAVSGLLLSQGVVRTTEPVSAPASAHGLTLDLRHWTDLIEKVPPDSWLHDVAYSDRARINGRFAGGRGTDVAAFELRVRAGGTGAAPQIVTCEKSAPDAVTPNVDDVCHFVVDLSPRTLRDPIEVSVIGKGPEARRSFTHIFRFERRTHYSLAWWEAVMGI